MLQLHYRHLSGHCCFWSAPLAASDGDALLRPLLPVQLGVALLHHLLETATVSVPVLDGCGMPIPGQMQVRMRYQNEVCGYLWIGHSSAMSAPGVACHAFCCPHRAMAPVLHKKSAPAGLMCTGSGKCSIHQLLMQADRARMRASGDDKARGTVRMLCAAG